MYICYVIVKDLPTMTAGKAAAQVHHSATQMAYEKCNAYQMWADKGEYGTNTTIVLRANVEEFELLKIKLDEFNFDNNDFDYTWEYGSYTDPTYPTVQSKTLEMETCIWIVGQKHKIKPLTKGLDLY